MLGLLPWEKWLPPYIYGPLLSIGSIYFLLTDANVVWWQAILSVCCIVLGAWATWAWFWSGENIFATNRKSEDD